MFTDLWDNKICDLPRARLSNISANGPNINKSHLEKFESRIASKEPQRFKRQEKLLSKTGKRKETLDQKEEGLRKVKERIEKEQEVHQRMFMSAQEQMDKDIENNDMVSVKAAREMLNTATKKLDAAKNHKNEQANI